MSAAQGNSANQRFFDKLLCSAGYHPIGAITFLMKQVKEVIDVLGGLVVVCARVPPAYTGGATLSSAAVSSSARRVR
jgi:hypothetical protein